MDAQNAFVGSDLRQVIPVAKRFESGVTLVAVEIYEDGLAIRWHRGDGDDRDLPPPLELTDSAGTTYASAGSGWAGNASIRGETTFVPAPPPDAGDLVIRHRDASVSVAASCER